MHIVSEGDNLHALSKPIIWENKKNIILSSANFFLSNMLRINVY